MAGNCILGDLVASSGRAELGNNVQIATFHQQPLGLQTPEHGGVPECLHQRVRAGAGVPCAKLARRCARWGLRTGEFFAGIPGTVGGALAMNAGAFGGETWRHVLSVDVVDRHGRRTRRMPDEYLVGYRSVEGPPGEWFLGADFRFESGEADGDS